MFALSGKDLERTNRLYQQQAGRAVMDPNVGLILTIQHQVVFRELCNKAPPQVLDMMEKEILAAKERRRQNPLLFPKGLA